MESLAQRIRELIGQLSQQLFEKEKPLRLALLSALAGESIFLLGPPGVAKSMIARRLKHAFAHAKAFEYLMGKFSTPDEVFGPVSISKLKNEDRYERLTANYLPGAQIVFLDEIWKASPAIQNSLLTVLNERIFRNGEQEFEVDIRGLIAASNELPAAGEGLEALWDRFLIRILVKNIEEDHHFEQLLQMASGRREERLVRPELQIQQDEYRQWRESIAAVVLPPHIAGLMTHLRGVLRLRNQSSETDNQLYVSDRRWRKIANLMRASAFFHGRAEVGIADCLLIPECIWNQETQMQECSDLVLGAIASHGYRRLVNLAAMTRELQVLQEEIRQASREVSYEKHTRLKPYRDKFNAVYYKLIGFWGESPAYIKASDYERLQPDTTVQVPIQEQTGNTFRPFQQFSFQLRSPFLLLNKEREIALETEESEREIVQPRIPSPEIRRVWQTETQLLLNACEQGLKKIQERHSLDEPTLQSHLFVSPDHLPQLLESLKTLEEELLALRLEVQKTRHSYESLATGGAGA